MARVPLDIKATKTNKKTNMNNNIQAYNESQSNEDKEICDLLHRISVSS
jgi:hypothetical protein